MYALLFGLAWLGLSWAWLGLVLGFAARLEFILYSTYRYGMIWYDTVYTCIYSLIKYKHTVVDFELLGLLSPCLFALRIPVGLSHLFRTVLPFLITPCSALILFPPRPSSSSILPIKASP